MSAHPASPLLLFLFFFLLHLALRSAELSATNTSIPHCKSFNCGDGVDIRYPLWYYEESDTSYCGYPKLGVVCEGDQPVLKLGDDRYRVANVSNNTTDITLQDLDLLSSGCSIPRHNLTSELEYGFRLLYTAGVDAYLFFFVNCSRSIIEDAYEIPCLGRGGSKSSYVSYGYEPIPRSNDWWGVCDELFVAPVLETLLELNRSNLSSSFGEILRGGFQLTWPQPENCWSCEKTGGKCGYASNGDVGGYDFQCFCNNGTFGWDCSGEGTLPDPCLLSKLVDW